MILINCSGQENLRIILSLFCLMITLCGCGRVRGTPVEVVTYYQNDDLMEHYGNVYMDYVAVEYEQIVVEYDWSKSDI